jgi:Restriction endonuclease
MQEPKWIRFEKLVYEIQKEFAGDAEVRLDDSILGADSGTNRQIDIGVRKHVGQYPILIVIDFRDYVDPIDVKDMEAFAELVKDVRANREAMIVSSGFTEAALTLARNHGIDTFRLVDTASVDWKSYAALSCLLERTYLKSYSLQVRGTGYFMIPYSPIELSELELRPTGGVSIGTSIQILRDKWDRAEMPRKPGHHEVLIGTNLSINYRGAEGRVDMSTSVIVGIDSSLRATGRNVSFTSCSLPRE